MFSAYVFPPAPVVSIPVVGQDAAFPVHRIYCVGRNYEDHAKEMGFTGREAPFFFMKAADAVRFVGDGETGSMAYPTLTKNLHHEIELVAAIGTGGRNIAAADAHKHIYGYAVGLDMTRRDLQLNERAKQRPWSLGKAFENSAPIAEITKAADFAEIGPQRIWLKLGEEIRQDAHLSDLVWSVPELIGHLSRFYHLVPGDLIFTGTPAGVGPLSPGDRITGAIDGLQPVTITIGAAE